MNCLLKQIRGAVTKEIFIVVHQEKCVSGKCGFFCLLSDKKCPGKIPPPRLEKIVIRKPVNSYFRKERKILTIIISVLLRI